MLGASRGRQERGHLASSYSSGSGRLDTGIVPKALLWMDVLVSLYFDE
jgi:hypothetical protein